MRHTLRISDQRILCLFCVLRISMNTFEGLLLVCNCVMLLRITQPTLGCGAHCVLRRVFKNTEFYGGGETSENSLNEPAELSLRCLAKTENDHVCRALRH